jgi:TonB family protein
LLISFALHCLGLTLFLLVRQHPTFVKPSSILAGKGGSSTAVVYLARNGVEATRVPRKRTAKKVPSPPIFVRNQEKLKTEVLTPESNSEQSSDTKDQAARAGSQFGSLLTGPVAGHEVRPALPVVFPDPVVHHSELPSGVQGDVVVEVTIDTLGKVVRTRVLRTVGYGIEEKVLAALENWRFKPATQDGVAILSQQDVYFHFPS